MRYRLRTLMTQFSVRDLIWLILVVASLTARWSAKREIASLRDDNASKVAAIQVQSQALAAAAKKEATLKREVELTIQMARNRQADLTERTTELRDSLQRREDVLKALRSLKDEPNVASTDNRP